MTYLFKYRRRSPFFTSRKVTGHRYEEKQDKMVIFYEDGSLEEIRKWRDCECALGTDWVLACKKTMEKDSGQTIPLEV